MSGTSGAAEELVVEERSPGLPGELGSHACDETKSELLDVSTSSVDEEEDGHAKLGSKDEPEGSGNPLTTTAELIADMLSNELVGAVRDEVNGGSETEMTNRS